MARVISSDGTPIGFDRRGDGPPLVFVDGASSYRAFSATRAEITALAAERTVYVYDRRHRGESGDNGAPAASREIDDLAAVIVEAGGVADVVAEASGAVLALDAAAAGVAIRRLTVLDAPLLVDANRSPVPPEQPARLERALAEGRLSDALVLFLSETTGLSPEYLSGMRQSPHWSAMEQVAASLAYDARLLDGLMAGNPLSTDRWAGVAVPVLVVTRDSAEKWVRTGADALVELLPTAQRRSLGPNDGEGATELAVIVDEFLRS